MHMFLPWRMQGYIRAVLAQSYSQKVIMILKNRAISIHEWIENSHENVPMIF